MSVTLETPTGGVYFMVPFALTTTVPPKAVDPIPVRLMSSPTIIPVVSNGLPSGSVSFSKAEISII